jgi:hypothetical protein
VCCPAALFAACFVRLCRTRSGTTKSVNSDLNVIFFFFLMTHLVLQLQSGVYCVVVLWLCAVCCPAALFAACFVRLCRTRSGTTKSVNPDLNVIFFFFLMTHLVLQLQSGVYCVVVLGCVLCAVLLPCLLLVLSDFVVPAAVRQSR